MSGSANPGPHTRIPSEFDQVAPEKRRHEAQRFLKRCPAVARKSFAHRQALQLIWSLQYPAHNAFTQMGIEKESAQLRSIE